MRIKYRAAFRANIERLKLIDELRSFGIFLKFNQIEVIEFYETDKYYQNLKTLFGTYNINIEAQSLYTQHERLESNYLGLISTWHHGYPQPEDDYKQLYYNLDDYCEECGIGAKQNKSLRMVGEPTWGRRQIFKMNWIFDEYFVKPEVYNQIFKPIGIGFHNVVKYKNETILKTVVQLKIPTVDSDLNMDGYAFEFCPNCYNKKFLPITIGGYPPLKNSTVLPIFKTKEYFGSGASGHKMVFVNNSLFRELQKNKIQGIDFIPVFER